MKTHTMKLLLTAISLFLFSAGCFGYDSNRLQEPVDIEGLEIPYFEFSLFKLPGTKLQIKSQHPLKLTGSTEATENAKELKVPITPGWYHYKLENKVTGEILTLHLFSLIPRSAVNEKGYLNHFNIGHYPNSRLKNQAIYDPPLGFIQVEKKDMSIHVSPNFTIGQFLSKQGDGFPKYLVLRPELIIKLERILRALNLAGHKTSSFHIMSGYRTPSYNRAIGNVPYSRHVWGGAADVFIDENPKDSIMDDLNGDGKRDKQDSIWLSGFIDAMSKRGEFKNLGGLGVYGSTSAHGPFVHVDVRGYRARW